MSADQHPDAPEAATAEIAASATAATAETTPATAEAAATPADAAVAPAAPPAPADAVAEPAAADALAAPAVADAQAAPAVPATRAFARFRQRGLVVVAGVTRVLRFAVMVGLFAVGIALGYQYYIASQPLPPGPAADPATAGNQPAPVIRELIAAVGSNDADRIRSAMPSEPYKLFTSEMQRWEFQEVTSVETLATFEDGTRTATSFVMLGRDVAGNPIAMTLVAETQDGNIVGFK